MTTPNHPIAPEELMAYFDGELAPAEATAAATHLEDCMECQQLAADLGKVSQSMNAWEVSAPSGSRTPHKIAAAINVRSAKQMPMPAIPMPWPLRLRHVFRLRAPLLASLAFLAIIGAIALRSTHQQPIAEQVASAIQGDKFGPPPAGPLSHSQRAILGDTAPPSESRSLRLGNSYSVDAQAISGQLAGSNGSGAALPAEQGQSRDRLQQFSKIEASPATTMIIRTAGLALITQDFEKARARVEDILRSRRGYVGTLTVTGAAGSGRTLTGSLRIPATQLDATLAELKTLGRLDSESQNGEDITSQYVDLNARLENARHTEQRLTDVLRERTGKLSDVLSVENEIARVRGEIESMEAQRKTLANQVNYATINLTITEDYRAHLQVVPPSTTTRLRNAAVEGYRNLEEGLISVALFFLESGPTLLLWAAILFFPARFAWKKLRHTFAQ